MAALFFGLRAEFDARIGSANIEAAGRLDSNDEAGFLESSRARTTFADCHPKAAGQPNAVRVGGYQIHAPVVLPSGKFLCVAEDPGV